jgi:hypothetical protein
MHDSRWIYWGNPSSTNSKNDTNVGSVVKDPPPVAGWLLHCISLHCLCLPYSCQHHIRQLALPSAFASFCVSFLSAPAICCVVSHRPTTLRPPPIASHTHGWLLRLPPAHPLSSLLRDLSSRCAVASHSAILAPLVRLVVTSPLQMPLPPICQRLHLSSCRRLSPRHGLQ